MLVKPTANENAFAVEQVQKAWQNPRKRFRLCFGTTFFKRCWLK